jgi:hypothetical protein
MEELIIKLNSAIVLCLSPSKRGMDATVDCYQCPRLNTLHVCD